MKVITFLTTLLLLLCGCKKEEVRHIDGGYFLMFKPRECQEILTTSLVNSEQTAHFISFKQADSNGVASDAYILCMQTGTEGLKALKNDIPQEYVSPSAILKTMQRREARFPLAPNNTRLERQLEGDVRNTTGKEKGYSLDQLYPWPWEYRVTGIRKFNIIATTKLFGQQAGTSLNAFFHIYRFSPEQIIDSRTKSLRVGIHAIHQIKRIDQWLALSPMAQPTMGFAFNSIPPEVPTRVSFVAILNTTDGKELRDTTTVMLK